MAGDNGCDKHSTTHPRHITIVCSRHGGGSNDTCHLMTAVIQINVSSRQALRQQARTLSAFTEQAEKQRSLGAQTS